MSEKKILLLTNVHVLYVLEDKTSKKNVRLSVWLSVCTYTGVHKCLQAHLEIFSHIYIQATSLRLMRDGWWLRSVLNLSLVCR